MRENYLKERLVTSYLQIIQLVTKCEGGIECVRVDSKHESHLYVLPTNPAYHLR
jgi:hypothetical protein